jgi:UDP-N-acetyl-D-glucosamine dehydrogenase
MLKKKIESKEATIGIVGLGYVGLPLAVAFADEGFRVLGIDTNADRVAMVAAGESYIGDAPTEKLAPLVERGLIEATTDFDRLPECDVIQICVPTPFTKSKDPDISYVVSASEQIANHLRPGQLVILKSTTFPETTEGVVLPLLETSGLKVGQDFYLSFSPERIDPGNIVFTAANTPTVVGGVTPECTELTRILYEHVIEHVHCVSSPRAAEMTKLLENIFRSVNIALVNELACLCDRMGGIDIWEVIEAASTKPFGFMPFYPGPGIGGHCILIDPYYLSWKAREYDFHVNFIELAAETNENMPYFVSSKLIEALSQAGIPASQARVLILGVAFKRDVADTRNSPALKVMEILADRVGELSYNDPFVPQVEVGGRTYSSAELTEEALGSDFDCVLIATDHHVYDYEWIVRHARLIVDVRNATGKVKSGREKIWRLGA